MMWGRDEKFLDPKRISYFITNRGNLDVGLLKPVYIGGGRSSVSYRSGGFQGRSGKRG